MITKWMIALIIGLSCASSQAQNETTTLAKSRPSNIQVEFKTSLGDFTIELYPDKAPKTAQNFLQYVKGEHYNGTIFHRVIGNFMVQGGGFTSDMVHKETRPPIPLEVNNGLKNEKGTVAMARSANPNSATSQFFINLADNNSLNGTRVIEGTGYAVFGKVIAGMETIEKIRNVPTKNEGKFQHVPVTPIVILSAISDAPLTVGQSTGDSTPATDVTKSTGLTEAKARGVEKDSDIEAAQQTKVSNVDATAGPKTLSTSRVSVGSGRCATTRTKVEQRDGELLVELERPWNCSFKSLIAKVAGQTLPIIGSRGEIRKGGSDYYYWPYGTPSGYVIFRPSRAITPAEAESLTLIQPDCAGECLSSLSEINKPFATRYKELQSAPGQSRFKFNPPDGIESDSYFFDRVSGNTWRRCDLGKKYSATERKCVGDSIMASWPEAVAIVQKLNEKNFEGANNWRLPTGADFASLLLNEPDFLEIRSMRHYKYGFAADDWFADYGEKTEVNYGGYYGGYGDRGEGQCRLAAQTLGTVLGGVNGIELVGRGDTAPKSHYRWLSDNYKWVSGQKLSRESNDWQNPRAIAFSYSCRNIITAFFKDNSNAQLYGLLVSHASIPLTIVRGADVPQEWTDAQAAVKNIDAINRQSKEAQNSRLNSVASFYSSIGSKIKDAYAAGSKASEQLNSASSDGSAEKNTSGTWKMIKKYEGGIADFGFDWRSTVYVIRCGSGAEKKIYQDKKGLWGTVGLGANNASSTLEDAAAKYCK